jgi:hypothetical protein
VIRDPQLRGAVLAGQRRLQAFDADTIGAQLPRASGEPGRRGGTRGSPRGNEAASSPSWCSVRPEIDGGAEYECRRVAGAPAHRRPVLTPARVTTSRGGTSTARASRTIAGPRAAVPGGPPAPRPRVRRYADWLYATPTRSSGEAEWVRRRGRSPSDRVDRAHADDHDGFLFYTYLYLPTTLGLRWSPTRRCWSRPPRRAADLPRSLPQPVSGTPRAHLPGGGGAGFRRGALPHRAPPGGRDRRGHRPGHRRRRRAVPAPAPARGSVLPLRGPRGRREGLSDPGRRISRLARAGGRAGHAGPHGHGRHEASASSGHPRPRFPAGGREGGRDRRGDGAGHALPLASPSWSWACRARSPPRAPRCSGPWAIPGPLFDRPATSETRRVLVAGRLRKALGGAERVREPAMWPITRQYLDFLARVFGRSPE